MNISLTLYFAIGSSFLILVVSGVSLYSPNDKLVLLENDTISTNLYNSPVAWFVEFYSSWCGHCQSFAPSWKRLAKEVQGWTNLIRVAAIDCSEARNLQACINFSIEGYPTLKFFTAYNRNTIDVGILYLGKRSPRKLRHALIDFLESYPNPSKPIDFSPVYIKLSDTFYKKQFKSKHLALLFENSTSYLGKELTLDLMTCPKVVIRRVVNDEERMKKYKVDRLPQVVLLVDKRVFHLVNRTRQGILAELMGFHVKLETPKTPEAIQATNLHYLQLHKNDSQASLFQTDISTVYMQDLEGALISIFRQELVIKKVFNAAMHNALKAFVDLLVQCFPGRPPMNNFLKLFQFWLKYRSPKNPVTADGLKQFLTEHQGDPSSELPETANWQLCQGRGYPCSLWVLFHTLTVNCEYLKPPHLSGKDVLVRIRGFIVNFFGCVECGKHFYAMSKNVENEVGTFDEGILWLWQAHNQVNKRLSHEPSIYPNFKKVQYPPKNICSECAFNTEPMPKWRKQVVMQFLKVHYGVNNIRLVTELKDVNSDEKDISESVRNKYHRLSINRAIGFSMTGFDTSLCLVVYGAGLVILILLYIYILRKRTRHGKYYSPHV